MPRREETKREGETNVEEIRFDDIDALKAKISEEYGDWGKSVDISQERVGQFADLTGDHQWIHLDVERAKKESPFGGPIVHGFFTLALLPQLHPASSYRLVGMGNATNYGADGLRFLSPVPCGSKVHARARLIDVQARPKGTLLTNETAIHVVGNDRPALIYKGLTLYNPPFKK
jgi:acyl dehydratase